MSAMSGYSGTSLVRKLGFKPGMRILTVGTPADYVSWLGDLPPDATLLTVCDGEIEAAHLFTIHRARLGEELARVRKVLRQDGMVWISWPKKASKVPTDVTEDVIRELALPMGFVDVKVCAVSEIWSGLKLVIRKSERR
jgi:hypothetical protein